MRIPLPLNYGAMPGGGFNPAQASNYQNQILGSQAHYAPQQAYANAILPMMQAQYMPYQIQAQIMSNPMMWMAAQSDPGMMTGMMKNMGNMLKTMPASMANMAPPPMGNTGGLLGAAFSMFDKPKTNAMNTAPGTSAAINPNGNPVAPPSVVGNNSGVLPQGNGPAPEYKNFSATADALQNMQVIPPAVSTYATQQGFTNLKPMGNTGQYAAQKNGQWFALPKM
jgi:hypothetical protein